jgi:hypothetical protein
LSIEHASSRARLPSLSGSRDTDAQFGLFAVISAICALFIIARPLRFLADDPLFYLVIAQHIAAGAGSTFNGLYPTNGYHPLWELCAAALAFLPHTRSSLLTYGILLQWLFGLCTIWVLLRALRPVLGQSGRLAFLGVMIMLFLPAGNLFWTEAPVSMLLVAGLMAMLLQEAPLKFGWLGVILGLLFLSRLDNVFLIGSAVAGLWWRDRDPRLLLTVVVCSAIAGVYLALNLLSYGHLMPISGAIKSAFYRDRFFSGQLEVTGWISVAGAAGLALMSLLRRRGTVRYRIAMAVLSCGVLLQSLYIVVLTFGDTYFVWYYVQGYLCVALLAAQIADWRPHLGRLPSGKALLVLSVLGAAAIAGAKFLFGSSFHDPIPLSADWRSEWIQSVERAVPDDGSVLVVFDQPGLFAFGTSHPVFPLDGLTSNYSVDASIAREGMHAWLTRMQPAYLVAPIVAVGDSLHAAVTTQTGVAGGQIIHFATPLAGADAGCIHVEGASLIATLNAPNSLHAGQWGIWKLTRDTMRATTCRDAVPTRSTEYFTLS